MFINYQYRQQLLLIYFLGNINFLRNTQLEINYFSQFARVYICYQLDSMAVQRLVSCCGVEGIVLDYIK